MKFSITFSFIAVALLIVCVHAMPAPMVTEEAEPDSLLEPVTTVMSNALPISVVEPTAVPIPVAIIETSMEPEVTAPPSYDTAPLKSIRVFIDGKAAQELYDGESAEIQLSSSKKVTFECITNGVDVGYVYFDINGKLEWTETKLPYVLGVLKK